MLEIKEKGINQSSKSPFNLSPVQVLCCGYLGIVSPRVIFTPFDQLKLLTDVYYDKGFNIMKNRVYQLGIPTLWNGCLCDIIRVPIQSAIRFLAYNTLKKYEDKLGPNRFFYIADNISTVFATTVTYPLEVVRTLMMSNIERYPNIPATASYILRKNGFKGLYAGLTPTLIGFFPIKTVQHGAYYLANRFLQTKLVNHSSNFVNFLVGTGISTLSQAANYPFDVIRRRMIADPTVKGMNFAQVVKHTYQERGVLGFYRSFGIACIRLIPMTCLQNWLTIELQNFVYNFNYQMKKHNFA